MLNKQWLPWCGYQNDTITKCENSKSFCKYVMSEFYENQV